MNEGDNQIVTWDIGKVLEDLSDENTVRNLHELLLIKTDVQVSPDFYI